MAVALLGIPLVAVLLFMVSSALAHSTDDWLKPQYARGSTLEFILTAPLHALSNAAQRTLSLTIAALNKVIGNHTAAFTNLIAGHTWSWNTYLSEAAQFAHAVTAALDHAFTVALPDAFADAKSYVDGQVGGVASDLATFKADVLDGYKTVAREIQHYVDLSVSTVERYADAAATSAYTAATRYADLAVDGLRTAESAAISDAVRIANETAAALPQVLTSAVEAADRDTAIALGLADAAGKSALDAVKAVAVAAGHDVTALDNYIAGLNLDALVKALPGIATIVTAIAVEAGLENAECRGKVKQICRTDANVWTALLGGAVALGVAFDFADVVRAGVEVEHLAASLLSKLGTVAEHDIQKAGRAVGEAAKAIAA